MRAFRPTYFSIFDFRTPSHLFGLGDPLHIFLSFFNGAALAHIGRVSLLPGDHACVGLDSPSSILLLPVNG